MYTFEFQAFKSNLIDGTTMLTVEDKLRHFRSVLSDSFFFLPRKHWWNIGETKVTTEKSVSKFRIAWAVVLRSFDMATGKTAWHLKEKVCSSAKSLYEWVANFLAIFSNGYLISGFNNTHTDILYKYARHLNSKRSPQFGLSDLAQFHFLLHHSILNHI